MSWSANPITTAPTAVVAKIRSCRITVIATANKPMTMESWTIVGKRSGSRSDRHGLMPARRRVDDAEREQERLDGRELSEQPDDSARYETAAPMRA